MPWRMMRAACLTLLLMGAAGAAAKTDAIKSVSLKTDAIATDAVKVDLLQAKERAEFTAALNTVIAHNRTALGYVRTGERESTTREFAALQAAWHTLVARFTGKHAKPPERRFLQGETLTVISARLIAVDIMLEAGRREGTRQALEALRGDLVALRKKNEALPAMKN